MSNKEDIPVNKAEVVETVEQPKVIGAEQEGVKQEADPFSAGRERMASIGQFFSKTKEKASSFMGRVGGAISRFGSRAVSFGGEAVAATLSADVLAKKGYNATANVVEKGYNATTGVVEKGYNATANVVEKGYNATAAGLNKGADKFVDGTNRAINSAGEWVYKQEEDFGAWSERAAGTVVSNYETAVKFKNSKVEEIKKIKDENVAIAKDVAFFAKTKTNEGFTAAKNGVEKGYLGLKAFGENSIAAGKMEASKIKESFQQKMNEIRIARIQAEYEKVSQKESAASSKAEQLRAYSQSLAEKMQLLKNLEIA